MFKQNIKNRAAFISTLVLILTGIFSRFIPHSPNFTPINSIALFSSSKFSKKIAIFIPLVIMFISDLVLGLHLTMIFVYLSLIIIYLIGFYFKKIINQYNLFLFSFISSIIFFLITNFGVWILFNMYPHNLSGLVSCYYMAIPFFKNTLIGDLIYNYLFYYGFRFLNNYFLKRINNWGML